MNLSLKWLKEYLIEVENDILDDNIKDNIEWINNNIGDEDVSVREWLDKVNDYWYKVGEEGGDSEFIGNMLEDGLKLSKEDVDMVMKEYWKDC
jgi:hypothetical protein